MPFSSNDPANYLAIGKQSSDTVEATSFQFLKYLNDASFDPAMETQDVYEGGDGQDSGLHYKSSVKPDGSVEVYARPNAFAYLGAYAMGSGIDPPSVAPGGVASHIYVPNATVPALTVEQSFAGGNEIERVMNAIISGFTVESEAKQPWKITVPMIGGGTYYGRPIASALTPAIEVGNPAMHAGGAYLIDGATSLWIQSFAYRFERKVDDDLFTVNVTRADVVELTRSLAIEMQVVLVDPTLYRKVQRNGGSYVPVDLATGSFHAERQIGASQLIALDVPLLNYTGAAVNRLNPDGETMVINVSAMAVKGATSLTQLRANIIGSATSYLR
jgi:hypothetical protein